MTGRHKPNASKVRAYAAARQVMQECLLQLPRKAWDEYMQLAFSIDTDPELMEHRVLQSGLLDPPRTMPSSFVCGSLIGIALLYCARAMDAAHGKNTNDPWQCVISAARLSGISFGITAGTVTPLEKEKIAKAARVAMAAAGYDAMVKSNPEAQAIRAAKEAIKDWWNNGAAIGPACKSGAAFDRLAVEKYPVISDTGTVKRWREIWARATGNGLPQKNMKK